MKTWIETHTIYIFFKWHVLVHACYACIYVFYLMLFIYLQTFVFKVVKMIHFDLEIAALQKKNTVTKIMGYDWVS